MLELTQYLQPNRYPGRGIVLGYSHDETYAVAAYFIMGRSENSRNRVFIETADGVATRPFDPAKVLDPSLIVYNAVCTHGDRVIVTNGDQTDTIYAHFERGLTFEDALYTRTYEPDAPNYTPRISGILSLNNHIPHAEMAILRKMPDGAACDYSFFPSVACTPGQGHMLHTYLGDGDPLPSFSGTPVQVLLPQGDADACAEAIWNALDLENRISLYVCYWNTQTGQKTVRIINRHQ
ncbi:IMP cyclohydrolase [Christensenellaceae bacterium OttesenSCG-928-L17]|nr:IMP cyclohydrolase [Christensenellaceae bacterium OttesenSCG-928-L17]